MLIKSTIVRNIIGGEWLPYLASFILAPLLKRLGSRWGTITFDLSDEEIQTDPDYGRRDD